MQFNRHFINRIEKKDVLRLLLALVAVFVIGVLGEFVCNFPALRANGWTRQATRTIALDEVQVSGFERVETEKNGLGEITGDPGQIIGENRRQVENTEVLQLSDASGYLHIPLDGSYVSQFLYHYDYDGLLNATVRLGYRNIYGEQRKDGHGPQLPGAEIFFGSGEWEAGLRGSSDYAGGSRRRRDFLHEFWRDAACTDRVCDGGAGRYQLVPAGTFLVCGGGFDRTSLFPGFRGKAHRGWISADLPDVWNNIFTVAPGK